MSDSTISPSPTAPGVRMSLIRRGSLPAVIDRAVTRTLTRHLGQAREELLDACRRTLRRELRREVLAEGRSIRGMTRSAFLAELDRSGNRPLEARDRAREVPCDGEHERELENLRRRIAKLTDSLSRTEGMLARLRVATATDEGLASIYRTVQGLSAATPVAVRKLEMLRAIFETNLRLQGKRRPAAA